MSHGWIAGLMIGVPAVIWVGAAVVQGYADFKSKPREPMEWCHKHGAFRKKHALLFHETTVCPRCYHEAWNNAGGKK